MVSADALRSLRLLANEGLRRSCRGGRGSLCLQRTSQLVQRGIRTSCVVRRKPNAMGISWDGEYELLKRQARGLATVSQGKHLLELEHHLC